MLANALGESLNGAKVPPPLKFARYFY